MYNHLSIIITRFEPNFFQKILEIVTTTSQPFTCAKSSWTLELKFTHVNGLNFKTIGMNEH
jgi:hypothetical protein